MSITARSRRLLTALALIFAGALLVADRARGGQRFGLCVRDRGWGGQCLILFRSRSKCPVRFATQQAVRGRQDG